MSQVGAVGARWLMKDRPVPSLAALGAEGGFPSGPCGNSVLFHAEIRGGNVDWLKGKKYVGTAHTHIYICICKYVNM